MSCLCRTLATLSDQLRDDVRPLAWAPPGSRRQCRARKIRHGMRWTPDPSAAATWHS